MFVDNGNDGSRLRPMTRITFILIVIAVLLGPNFWFGTPF